MNPVPRGGKWRIKFNRSNRQGFSMQGSILLAEDNPDDVEITLHTLRKIAVDVVVARDGDEAFEYLFGKSATELPLLVLLDLNLPRMNGVEVLKRIRAEDRTRSLPVVLLTDSRAE